MNEKEPADSRSSENAKISPKMIEVVHPLHDDSVSQPKANGCGAVLLMMGGGILLPVLASIYFLFPSSSRSGGTPEAGFAGMASAFVLLILVPCAAVAAIAIIVGLSCARYRKRRSPNAHDRRNKG